MAAPTIPNAVTSDAQDAATSITATMPTHLTDDILNIVLISTGAVQTPTTPSGWALEVTHSVTAQTDRDISHYTKKATSGSESNEPFTGLTSADLLVFCWGVRDTDLTTWMDATPTTATANNDDTPAPASITTVTADTLVCVVGGDEKGTAYSPSSGYNEELEDTSGSTNGMIQSISEASIGLHTPGNYSVSHSGGGPDVIMVTIAFRPVGATVHQVTATITGAGAVSGADLTLVKVGAAVLPSTDSDISAVPNVTVFGAAVLPNTDSDISAVPLVTTFGAAVLPSTDSDISATGAVVIFGAAVLPSTASDISATGTVVVVGAAVLPSTASDISATGFATAFATATISGTSDIAATPLVTTFGVAPISGAGDISATGAVVIFGAAVLPSTASDISAVPLVTTFGVAPISGAGDIAASGFATRFGIAALSGTGALSATGDILADNIVFGSARAPGDRFTAAGDTRIASTGDVRITNRPNSVAGVGAISAVPSVTTFGTVVLSGTSDLSGVPLVTVLSSGILRAAGNMSVIASTHTGPPGANLAKVRFIDFDLREPTIILNPRRIRRIIVK